MNLVVHAEPPLFRAALVGDLVRELQPVPEKHFARMMMPVCLGHILSQPSRFRSRLLTRSSSEFFVSAADITSTRNLVHREIPFVIGVGLCWRPAHEESRSSCCHFLVAWGISMA